MPLSQSTIFLTKLIIHWIVEHFEFFLLLCQINYAFSGANLLWEYAFGDIFSAAYKLPVDVIKIKPEQDSNNNDLYRTLGGVRLRYKFLKGTGNYTWTFSENGRVCPDFDMVSTSCTEVASGATALSGLNETTVYWEPLEWTTNLNATGTVRIDKPGQEAEEKTFSVVSRELSPNATDPIRGSDVEMLEQMLWMLGRSSQYGYRGKGANRIDLSRDTNLNYGTNTLDVFSVGYTSSSSALTTEQKQIGTMEQMVWRFRYQNELDTTNRIVNNDFLTYLKKHWTHYISALHGRLTTPMDGDYNQGETNSFDYWCAQAALEWDWGSTYTETLHQGIMQQIGTPNITRADLIKGWIDQESSKSHWGRGGNPQTPYRMVIGSADSRGSIGFNQIQTRYIYGASSRNDCASCTDQNMYDPYINVRSLVLFTTRPGCNPSMRQAFTGVYDRIYDNTNYPRITRSNHDSNDLPDGANYETGDYERLSKAIGAYNQGSLYFENDDRTWPELLSTVNPVCSTNTGDNRRICEAMKYAIEVKDKSSVARRSYFWRDIENNNTIEFWYGESDWYGGTTWADRRQEILNQQNNP